MLTPAMKEVLLHYPDAVFVGGSALQLHGVRRAKDVDVWVPKLKAGVDLPGVDITDDKYIWGQISVADINKVAKTLVVDGIKVRALDLASIYIHKADSARDKDLDDLLTISNHITAMDIAKRMADLTEFNPGDDFQMVQENLMQEIAVNYNGLDPDVVNATGLRDEFLDNAMLLAYSMMNNKKSTGISSARY